MTVLFKFGLIEVYFKIHRNYKMYELLVMQHKVYYTTEKKYTLKYLISSAVFSI